MRRKPLVLLTLLLMISTWIMWTRWLAMPSVAASDLSATTQPTAQPTTLSPMPTPAITIEVQADWPLYTSPYWGITFHYPPHWEVQGSETHINFPANATDGQRIAQTVGMPIYISSAQENQGGIYLSLQTHTRSPGISLADWVILNDQVVGMTGIGRGPTPMQLSTIPTSYLPATIDEAIYSVYQGGVNPGPALWLERDGMIYTIGSTYHRLEDIARIFAIVSSLEFDPTAEELLRASGGLQGDQETMRQYIAANQPEPTPECDMSCQAGHDYIANYVAPAATAKALPPLQRPTPQPYSPLPVGKDWLTYEQPIMGIRFRLPPDWTVFDPFKANNLDTSAILGTGISLTPNQAGSGQALGLYLSPYLLGKDTPLSNWEALQDQITRFGRRDDNFNFPYRIFPQIDPQYFPRQADDMIWRNEILISINNLVYIAWATSPEAFAVLASLEFDQEQLEKIRAQNIFLGDEKTLAKQLAANLITPTITPIPSPTPTVRATVTPSAFESPLLNGRKRYQGEAGYTDMPPFEFWFDPTMWQLMANEGGTDYLVHQHLIGCEINLRYAPFEAMPLAPFDLAGYHWTTTYFDMNGSAAIGYYLNWGNGAYMFTLILPEPIADPYDAHHMSHCQRYANAVFDTFTILGVTPSSILGATATPATNDAPMPTVTPPPLTDQVHRKGLSPSVTP